MDNRTGSAELAKHFTPYGIRCELARLDYGDFDFEGKGPKGRCAVVFERKRIEDLVQSMESGRLSGHQLPGMSKEYDYAYLIIEGIWRPGPDGQLEVNNSGRWVGRRTHTRAITNYVMGLALRAGLLPWRTGNQQETVAFIVDQFRMFDKAWAEHRAHDVVYAPASRSEGFRLSLMPRKIRRAEKVAMQLGLQDKARYAADAFRSVKTLVNATPEEWSRVEWRTRKGQKRKIGMVTGEKIVTMVEEEE